MAVVKYQLTLTPEQLSVVKRACEFLSRIRIGQLDELDRELFVYNETDCNETQEACCERYSKFRDKLFELEHIFSPTGQTDLLKDRTAETAWNIYQVTRYKQAWHDHPEGGYTVDFHTPMDLGGVGLPVCEVIEE